MFRYGAMYLSLMICSVTTGCLLPVPYHDMPRMAPDPLIDQAVTISEVQGSTVVVNNQRVKLAGVDLSDLDEEETARFEQGLRSLLLDCPVLVQPVGPGLARLVVLREANYYSRLGRSCTVPIYYVGLIPRWVRVYPQRIDVASCLLRTGYVKAAPEEVALATALPPRLESSPTFVPQFHLPATGTTYGLGDGRFADRLYNAGETVSFETFYENLEAEAVKARRGIFSDNPLF